MKFGLCCKFLKENIKFKEYTLTNIKTLSIESAREKILNTFNSNLKALQDSFDFCNSNGIDSFRVSSNLIPHLTNLENLGIVTNEMKKKFSKEFKTLNSYNLILSMHPGQFVNMGSPNQDVIEKSILDVKEHFFVAEGLNIHEINFHIGGSYGDRESTKKRFIENMNKSFTQKELDLITIENDELNFSISDVLEVCEILKLRATFDIHHQRVFDEIQLKKTKKIITTNSNNSDNSDSLEYSKDILKLEKEYKNFYLKCKETWKARGYKYQRMHISSPKIGYGSGAKGRPHHDFIDISHIPNWMIKDDKLYVDIEAKAKEVAIFQLRDEINKNK